MTIGSQVPRILIPLTLIAAAAAAFIWLVDEVGEGDTHRFDHAIILGLRVPGDTSDPIGPRGFEDAVRDVTALGSAPVLVIAVLAVVGFLALARSYRLAAFTLAASLSGLALSSVLKFVIDRPRPELVPPDAFTLTSSFPSGHSMMSAVIYLTLAALVARLMERRRLKLYALGIAITLTFLVGTSRVYLGVHWPTDVLAGWSAGAAWALLCWFIASRIGLGRDSDD